MNLIGKVLANRYEILEEVGSGGMAIVYKAKCQLLNRFVAVKVLRKDLQNDAEFVRRFNVEAQAAASLAHPNIVSIHDVGNEDGLHYIVMEYVEGETLKDYIDKKHVLPWREAVNYAVQIGKGLDQAHKNSIVHRDIKPHNIIMTNDGVLKVTDFGIARANVQSTMTAEDSAIGSVHYISPEQARGGYTDARSDIYSLGIVLYEMLTGVVPFDNESPVTIAIKHLQEAPVPPREHNISIPLALEKIVLKAIAKELSMRYKNVSEFIEDLQTVLNDPDRIIDSIIEENNDVSKGYTRKMPVITREEAVKTDDKVNREGGDTDMATGRRGNHSEQIDKKKEKKVILYAVISAIVVITVMAFALSSLLGLGSLSGGGGHIVVPKLEGKLYDEVVEEYKDAGFSIVKGKTVASQKEEGTILAQDPKPGSKIKKNGEEEIVITVEISEGAATIKLKDYTKYVESRKAEVEVENLGLRTEIIEEFSDEIPSDSIIRQEPAAGTMVKKGDKITFYVSKGPEDPEDDDNSIDVDDNNNSTSNNNSGTETPVKKKSTMLTVLGPTDKDSALVQVNVNGKTVYTETLTKGSGDTVELKGTSDFVDVEILYDGVVRQSKRVALE